jgi:hypothetical protein
MNTTSIMFLAGHLGHPTNRSWRRRYDGLHEHHTDMHKDLPTDLHADLHADLLSISVSTGR